MATASTSVDSNTTSASQIPALSSQSPNPSFPLRIIYTLNNAPQSLLARQRKKVPVFFVDDGCGAVPPDGRKFAKVMLKTCLAAICSSSPELLADDSHDYSVYVVDPMESAEQSTGSSSGANGNTGVSVGVGLLSWWLFETADRVPSQHPTDDDDDGYVVGRLIKDRGMDTVEIVMSFREICKRPQREHALSFSSLGLSQSSLLPSSSQTSTITAPPTRPSTPTPDPIHPKHSSELLLRSQREETMSRESSPPVNRNDRSLATPTYPEKKARRQAILSHKEQLNKIVNLAKMQRGEPYDTAIITEADSKLPKITDEAIMQQKRILEELERQPIIVDQRNLMTTKPLTKRGSSSRRTSMSRTDPTNSRKRRPLSPTPNAVASSSKIPEPPSVKSPSVEPPSVEPPSVAQEVVPENHLGKEILASIFAGVLSKVDGSALSSSQITEDGGKGKGREEAATSGLTEALGKLLPYLSNTSQLSNIQQALTRFPALTSSVAPPSNTIPSFDPRAAIPPQQPPGQPQRLFTTTEETFYNPPQPGTWPYDQHWAVYTHKAVVNKPPVNPPLVHPDSHPVPGGGWARGKTLVPRSATAASSSTPSENQFNDRDAAPHPARPMTVIDLTQPDKENMPPPQTSRGLKRSSSMVSTNDKSAEKAKSKKRKQDPNQSSDNDGNRTSNSRRTVMGSTEANRSIFSTSGISGQNFSVSSPVRNTSAAAALMSRSMTNVAVSEPDYQARAMPIVASSSFPDVIMGPPKTPPRREGNLDEGVGASLFTPGPQSTPRAKRDLVPDSSSLFTPSPKRASRGSHVVLEILTTSGPPPSVLASEIHSVKTGWDLPPSSPPPPTSPVSPKVDFGGQDDDTMIFNGTPQSQRGLSDGEGNHTSKVSEDVPASESTNESASTPTAHTLSIALGSSAACSDFDLLVSEANFNFGNVDEELGFVPVQDGIDLDINELWNTLGPVIAQAQNDSSGEVGVQSAEAEQSGFDLFSFGYGDGTHTSADMQNNFDTVKLAEDLKALFGGCVL